ncbi:MAG: hypothetical protein DMD87_02220 [Candidatus Rokuibacteriota bacterium]|nr:MAG: hypothetical protein DMD87_02220 [Candidatus Rokubacteria bacterium]
MTTRAAALAGLVLLIPLVFQPGVLPSAEAAGPWQAQVVDGGTKQPLEGVVVLAWWTRHVRSFGGPSEEYRDSQEVLTDTDGRFTIESRRFFSLNPLVFFRGPFVAMFKSGYGDYEWPGYSGSQTWPKEKREALRTEAQLLQLDGIVLELPRRLTADQRKEYLKHLEVHVLTVPLERRPLLQKAIGEERRALGYGSRRQP